MCKSWRGMGLGSIRTPPEEIATRRTNTFCVRSEYDNKMTEMQAAFEENTQRQQEMLRVSKATQELFQRSSEDQQQLGERQLDVQNRMLAALAGFTPPARPPGIQERHGRNSPLPPMDVAAEIERVAVETAGRAIPRAVKLLTLKKSLTNIYEKHGLGVVTDEIVESCLTTAAGGRHSQPGSPTRP